MSKFFWDNITKYNDDIALIIENESMSYNQLCNGATSIVHDIPTRSFVFLVCRNCMASIVAYIGFLQECHLIRFERLGFNQILFKFYISGYFERWKSKIHCLVFVKFFWNRNKRYRNNKKRHCASCHEMDWR